VPENKRKEGWYWVRVRDYKPFPAVWNGKTFEDANEEMLNEEDYAGPFVVVGSIPLPDELALQARKAAALDDVHELLTRELAEPLSGETTAAMVHMCTIIEAAMEGGNA
jgi:hypothetical protein